MLDGRHQDLSMSELSGGARIRHVFVEVYGKGLRELSPQRDVRDDEISTVIKNGAGVSGGRQQSRRVGLAEMHRRANV